MVRIGIGATSALEMPAADTSTSWETRSGNWIATSAAMYPPIELPTRSTFPSSSLLASSFTHRPYRVIVIFSSSSGSGVSPKPGRSMATTRRFCASRGRFSSQFCHWPPSPCTNTTGSRSPDPMST